jgi:hypothetical protein
MASWIDLIKFAFSSSFNLFFFFLLYCTQNVNFPCSSVLARALATVRGLLCSSRKHSGVSEQLNELVNHLFLAFFILHLNFFFLLVSFLAVRSSTFAPDLDMPYQHILLSLSTLTL